MNLYCFANVLVKYPLAIVLVISVISSLCLVIPFVLNRFPSFSDPQLGFATRGTTIAKRIITWENLVESTKPSGQFTVNPKEYLLIRNKTKTNKGRKKKKYKQEKYANIFVEDKNFTYHNDEYSALRELKKFNFSMRPSLPIFEPGEIFCGAPDEKYAHIVVKGVDNRNLFNLKSLQAICRIEHEFVDVQNYNDLCIENTKTGKCCKPWSISNYIAALNGRKSCLGITEEDVNSTIAMLKKCAQDYFTLKLLPDCSENLHCKTSLECIRQDAVYNIFNFLANTEFISYTDPQNGEFFLRETVVFFPIAGSTAILPYYHKIKELELTYDGIEVVAINFGIKNILFDECLLRDTWLMGFGVCFILVCIWWYTTSLFLTAMTITAIVFSLGVSYFMYLLVFRLDFFPFMNLLAIIVVIGIGSDDAFIFCKVWSSIKHDTNSSVEKLMSETFHHAFVSIFVTTLTTSVAFLASYISSITAICCFSIFAGTAVVVNYVLMVTWFPACIVLMEKLSKNSYFTSCFQRFKYDKFTRFFNSPYNALLALWSKREAFLLALVIRLRYFWIILLLTIALASVVVVLYYPKLKLPNSEEFQLFTSSHPFEQYDFIYKNHFWFQRESFNSDGSNYNLPLRFVWGVLPEDNGDYLNPTSLGTLRTDPEFDMANPQSQEWLLKFCRRLRRQPFYQPTLGPLYPNCFIETFMKSMQRPCIENMSQRDRSPCCKSAKFPFNTSIFNECIIQEIADIYETPAEFMLPGVAGPKFSKDQSPTIKAVIVEYPSNHSYSMSYEVMHEFYTMVETWMRAELETAPAGMRNGFFVSELKIYDLQRELATSTITGVALSMGLAFVVLVFSTLNLLISLYAIATITCSIFVTISVLVLLGWKLNILESVAISTAIGLTVDFSLHYSVNYRLTPHALKGDRLHAVRFALSNMAGPAFMAAITTGASGAFMLPSLILPYIQIGIFLVTVMSISWIYATFFLGSLLAVIGPQNYFGQFKYSSFLWCVPKKRDRGVPPDAEISTDALELDALTSKVSESPRNKEGAVTAGGSRYVFSDQSPSAASTITIIMGDDNYT